MDLKRVDSWLDFSAVAAGLLVVLFALSGSPQIAALFGGLAALSALGAHFTGQQIESDLDSQIDAMEAEQAGRTLSPEQLQQLTRRLRAAPRSDGPINLTGLQGDREAIRLAHVLKQVLVDAEFVVDGVWEDALIGGTGPGILIRQTKKEDSLGAAINVALHQVGLDAKIVVRGVDPPTRLEIIVGYKPFDRRGTLRRPSASDAKRRNRS